MSKIIVPTPLRKFTDGSSNFVSSGTDVASSLKELAQQYPGISQHLFDDAGKVRSFIKVFVGDEDIIDLQNEQTQVAEHTVISIVPAIAGGSI
jgi:molybdopterin converting factor small subunit